jgi:hypothetical protein
MRTMSKKNRWTAGSGRWKSTPDKGAQVREPLRPPEPETPAKPMTLAERIPTLSDSELAALQANALRISENADDKKAASAAELLPLIAAELAQRAVSKAAAGVQRKKDMAADRVAKRERRVATAAAEAAGVDIDDSDEAGEND